MPSELMNNTIKAIIALGVILVIVAIVFLFAKQVLPVFRGENISSKEQEQAQTNFDILIDNIKKCQEYKNSDCLCEGLPNFPGSFPTKSKIVAEEVFGKKTRISFVYGKRTYINKTMENLKINAILINKGIRDLSYLPYKEIDFKHEPPYFKQDNLGWGHGHFRKVVISSYLYKKDNKDNEVNEIDFIIGSNKDLTNKEIKEKIKQIKMCNTS